MLAVVVGNTGHRYSLEAFVIRALEDIGWTVSALQWPLHTRRHHAKLRRGAHALALPLPGTRQFIDALRDASKAAELTLLVKVPELFRHRALPVVAESRRSILLAPDRLGSFIETSQLEPWLSSGGWVATFDPSAEEGAVETSRVVEFKFGYDRESHWRKRAGRPFRHGAVFVGTWDPQREAILHALAGELPVTIAGNFWRRARSPRIHVIAEGNIYGQHAAALMQEYQYALNIPRPQNYKTGNMRTYELPAGGALPFILGQRAQVVPSELVVAPGAPSKMARLAADRMLHMSTDERADVTRSVQDEVRPCTYTESVGRLLDLVL